MIQIKKFPAKNFILNQSRVKSGTDAKFYSPLNLPPTSKHSQGKKSAEINTLTNSKNKKCTTNS